MYQVRQGDVFIVAVDQIPADATAQKREGGKIILAYGEATGHHHAIIDADAELLAMPSTDLPVSEQVDRWLRVGQKGATLEHQEHAAVLIPPGEYRIVRQREYSPEAIRNVAD